jgi:hypothetical protein
VRQRKRKKKKAMTVTLPSPSFSSAAKKEEDFSSLLQTKQTKKPKKNVSILPFRGRVGPVLAPAAPTPAPHPQL